MTGHATAAHSRCIALCMRIRRCRRGQSISATRLAPTCGRLAALRQPVRDAPLGPGRVDHLERRSAGDQQPAAIAGLAAALAVEDRAIEADPAIERGRDLGLTAPCVGVFAKQLLGHPEASNIVGARRAVCLNS